MFPPGAAHDAIVLFLPVYQEFCFVGYGFFPPVSDVVSVSSAAGSPTHPWVAYGGGYILPFAEDCGSKICQSASCA